MLLNTGTMPGFSS